MVGNIGLQIQAVVIAVFPDCTAHLLGQTVVGSFATISMNAPRAALNCEALEQAVDLPSTHLQYPSGLFAPGAMLFEHG